MFGCVTDGTVPYLLDTHNSFHFDRNSGTRTSHDVKLYVHFLSCFFCMSVIFISKYVLLNNILIYVSA
jgi:hypothetical protein